MLLLSFPKLLLICGFDSSKLLVNTTTTLPNNYPNLTDIFQVTLDMTPSKFAVNEMLGGTPTFVGQYVKIGAVVMARRDDGHLGTRQEGEEAAAETIKDKTTLPLNKHIPLRAPLDTELVAGDMVLIRMDEEGEPVDLTLSEYTTFKDTIVVINFPSFKLNRGQVLAPRSISFNIAHFLVRRILTIHRSSI